MATQKRGMRKLPSFVVFQRLTFTTEFHVAVVRRISVADIQAGVYAIAGLFWSNGQPCVSGFVKPSREYGRFSKINADGQEIVRRDLEKITKAISFTNPCLFGEWGRVCHITQYRLVYQREQIAPPNHSIDAVVLHTSDDSCIVRFQLAMPFLPASNPTADRELLFALNLLKECIGGFSIFPVAATLQDYLGSVHVQWKILPAGERDKNICLILASFKPKDLIEEAQLKKLIADRYDFFQALGAKQIISGLGGMDGYLGAMIQDDIVVFENLSPGNGIYILFGDWQEQSQKTKTDLLTHGKEGKEYIRVTHTGDWQLRVHNEISARVQ